MLTTIAKCLGAVVLRAWPAFVVSFVTGAFCAESLGSMTIPFLWGLCAGGAGVVMGVIYVVAERRGMSRPGIWVCYSAVLLAAFVLLEVMTIFFPPPEGRNLQQYFIGVCLMAGVLSWPVLMRKPSPSFVFVIIILGITWLAMYTIVDPATIEKWFAVERLERQQDR